ncbi:MAG: hypothetical protein RL166_105 [Actinomycetota bacterium]
MISLYRPGASPLHNTSAGIKLLALAFTFALFGMLGKNLVTSAGFIAGLVVCNLLAGLNLRNLLKQLWQIKVLVAIVLVPQIIFNGFLQGANNSVAIVVGVLLASLISITTKTSEIVDLIQRITRSRSFALLIALSINSIGLVIGFSKNITEAGLARGVRQNPVRQIVTLFVVSLRFADDYAEGLAARGVRV